MSGSGKSELGEFLSPVETFMVGGVVGAITKTLAAPYPRSKIIFATQRPPQRYDSLFDVFLRVPKEQGVAALWRGNLADVIRHSPTQALNFMFKDEYKKIFKGLYRINKNSGFGLNLAYNVSAGGAAGATALAFVHPLDFARTRLIVGSGADREFKGTFDTIMKTAQKHGMFKKGGVYSCFWINCGVNIVYRGLYFGLYDLSRIYTPDILLLKFCIGYMVSTVAGIAACPVDTVCSRMMINSGSGMIKYSSSLAAFSTIAKEEGIGAFFRGALSRRGAFSGSLVLVGFDEFKKACVKMKHPGAFNDAQVR